jgi:hypothetical protein
MTALLDAVGKTINDVVTRHASLEEDEKPGKVILVVITDGHENSSREITQKAELVKMVNKQEEDYGWEIVFLGADIDAWGEGSSMGFSKSRGVSKDEMFSNMSKMSYYTANMRNSNSRTYDDKLLNATFDMSVEDIKKQMDDLKKKK